MKWMPIIWVGLGFAGFLYGFINPAAIKRNSELAYKALRFPEQPIWFWRILAGIGLTGCLITLLKIAL